MFVGILYQYEIVIDFDEISLVFALFKWDATNLRKGLDLGPKPLDLVLDLDLIADIGFGFGFGTKAFGFGIGFGFDR
ncbi:unnamed protein product [Rotaria magnacalcarata]